MARPLCLVTPREARESVTSEAHVAARAGGSATTVTRGVVHGRRGALSWRGRRCVRRSERHEALIRRLPGGKEAPSCACEATCLRKAALAVAHEASRTPEAAP